LKPHVIGEVALLLACVYAVGVATGWSTAETPAPVTYRFTLACTLDGQPCHTVTVSVTGTRSVTVTVQVFTVRITTLNITETTNNE
jgi:hypothetical protein